MFLGVRGLSFIRLGVELSGLRAIFLIAVPAKIRAGTRKLLTRKACTCAPNPPFDVLDLGLTDACSMVR